MDVPMVGMIKVIRVVARPHRRCPRTVVKPYATEDHRSKSLSRCHRSKLRYLPQNLMHSDRPILLYEQFRRTLLDVRLLLWSLNDLAIWIIVPVLLPLPLLNQYLNCHQSRRRRIHPQMTSRRRTLTLAHLLTCSSLPPSLHSR